MQNLETDKAIAKFLDINVRVFQEILIYDKHPQIEIINVFSPHDDWNNLMWAIDKIEKLGFKFKMCRSRVMVYYDETPETSPIFEVKGVDKHSAAYSAVGNFIAWDADRKK